MRSTISLVKLREIVTRYLSQNRLLTRKGPGDLFIPVSKHQQHIIIKINLESYSNWETYTKHT